MPATHAQLLSTVLCEHTSIAAVLAGPMLGRARLPWQPPGLGNVLCAEAHSFTVIARQQKPSSRDYPNLRMLKSFTSNATAFVYNLCRSYYTL